MDSFKPTGTHRKPCLNSVGNKARQKVINVGKKTWRGVGNDEGGRETKDGRVK